ncbi:serine/threonine-protein kinase-like protein [Bimuria novae-zelandiae CBS 107.79]|uniref:Serine/threonine-protein kinase-like protein n=1 Tax=Bimuria novae-zelandiae CBS 107.79 TaxID=1447943 RepID=A0A6A5VBI1_9PLEO|nr:serine/threonine-protein kinase-like protein [Bimuria novae-zelandiae CBS 107.79]
MGMSPAVSPRPNPPGSSAPVNAAKAKSLVHLVHNKTAPSPSLASAATTPGGPDADEGLAEEMNDKVANQFAFGPRLGEGTYATVFRGHYRDDPSKLVAIKKMKKNAEWQDGINLDSLREMKYLAELHHPYLIELIAVFTTKDENINLVLEHLPGGELQDLWQDKTIAYGGADVKAWANMLCQAVWWLHENFVLHRDIKSNNIIIAADNSLKLADFGLARTFANPEADMTYNVITRFYRPPELFLGSTHYGGCVDMWSVGCVIAEVAIREFFLPSATDLAHLGVITEVFGVPTEQDWPGLSKLRFWKEQMEGLPPKRPQPLSWWKQRMPLIGDAGIDLVRGLLTMDPSKRLSARQALDHHYWTSLPRPQRKELLPKKGGKEGEKAMGEQLKRVGGEIESGRTDKVARKLDFGAAR